VRHTLDFSRTIPLVLSVLIRARRIEREKSREHEASPTTLLEIRNLIVYIAAPMGTINNEYTNRNVAIHRFSKPDS
jgi:hypothetical protein